MERWISSLLIAVFLWPATARAITPSAGAPNGAKEGAAPGACPEFHDSALVPQDSSPRAKALFRSAHQAYGEGRYVLALESFKLAYRLCPTPELLYNIAQVHRQMDDCPEALEAYRQYLLLSTNREVAALTRQHIQELERQCGVAASGRTDAAPAKLHFRPNTPTALGFAAQPPTPPPPAAPNRQWAKTATWISLALMGTATLLTFKFSGDVGRMDSRLDQYRRYPCDGDSGLCDENNNPAEPLSESEQQRSAEIMQDARSFSLLSQVSLLGATSTLVTTGVFAYLGYWAPARKTATVSGAIAPGSMGLAAHVTF